MSQKYCQNRVLSVLAVVIWSLNAAKTPGGFVIVLSYGYDKTYSVTMIDITDLLSKVDIGAVVERDLGPAARRHGRFLFWRCPFHADKDPSLGVTPDNGRWYCFGACRKGGDALDWVQARQGVSLVEAARQLGAMELPERPVRVVRTAAPDANEAPGLVWQEAARVFINRCEQALWDEGGERVVDYLRGRGLEDETLRAWRVGYHPVEEFAEPERWGFPRAADGKRHGVWLPAGVLLPCIEEDVTWRLKFRSSGKEKYPQVRGSRPALYGASRMRPGMPALVCEGEFDALVAWQEAGDLVDVVAAGGARMALPPRWRPYLMQASELLVAFDVDQAGDEGAAAWTRATGRARRAVVPEGRDVTEFWQAGGDVRAWVEYELERGTR